MGIDCSNLLHQDSVLCSFWCYLNAVYCNSSPICGRPHRDNTSYLWRSDKWEVMLIASAYYLFKPLLWKLNFNWLQNGTFAHVPASNFSIARFLCKNQKWSLKKRMKIATLNEGCNFDMDRFLHEPLVFNKVRSVKSRWICWSWSSRYTSSITTNYQQRDKKETQNRIYSAL